MDTQDWLTVFVALTAVAVLIQTGIVIGMYVLTNKINKGAERASQQARAFMSGRAIKLTEELQSLTSRLAEYGLTAQVKLQQIERKLDEKENGWHQKLSRWVKKTA
jgi:hypothetical protein